MYKIKALKKVKKKHILLVAMAIFIMLISYFILPVAKPIVLALITAFFLERIVQITTNKMNMNRTASVITVFFAFVIIAIGLVSFAMTKSIIYIVTFAESLPVYLNHITEMYLKAEEFAKILTQDLPKEFVKSLVDGANDTFTSMLEVIKEKLSLENVTTALKVVPSFIVSFIVYLLALFFIMLDFPNIKKNIKGMMKPNTKKNVSFIINKIEEVVYGVVRAQITISLYVLLITFVGLLILAPEHALMMSIIILIIDLLPIVGSIIVLLPWGLFEIYLNNSTVGFGLIILSVVIIVFRRIIEPKIMSVNIGLSPLATLISIFIGFKLLGISGLVLGPLILIVYNSLREEGILKFDLKF